MKTYKKITFKHIAALFFLLALVLPTNVEATTGKKRDRDTRQERHRDGRQKRDRDATRHERVRDGRRGHGNADGGLTGETGYHDTERPGGNCGHGPNQHAGNACGGDKHTDSIPLDGGLGILVLGAAAFGIKKLRGNKEDK
mgnify:CR=1 FL=1